MKRARGSFNLCNYYEVMGSKTYGGEDGESSRKARMFAKARKQAQRENGKGGFSPLAIEEKNVVVKKVHGEKGEKNEAVKIIEVKGEVKTEEIKEKVVARGVKTKVQENLQVEEEQAGGALIFEELECMGFWGDWIHEEEQVWREWVWPSCWDNVNGAPWVNHNVGNVGGDFLPNPDWSMPPVVASPEEDDP